MLQTKRVSRSLSRRLRDFGAVQPEGFDLGNVPTSDIAIHFADGPPKLYQLTQWLPIFEASTTERTIVVVRQIETFQALQGATSLPILLAPTYEDLMALYDRADFHAVMYVNNGFTNFQSLAFQQAVHIHLNHGESDKICMVSNQAKAYDKVFVAGPAAVRRHAAAITWFDITHLARVGRPQLDLPVPNPLTEFAGTTITYAPTWEGEDDANNYTSLDVYGPSIISAALTLTNCRVIYKPHPRVADSNNAAVKASHRKILTLLNSANSHDPNAGHRVMLDANVLGIIRGTDLLIADVSSVTLDHLYLRPQAPIVLCDRRTNRAQLLSDAPVAAGAHILDQDTIATLASDLADIIANDQQEAARGALRDFYFDGLEPGQSTERFWQQTRFEISEHDRALQELSRVRKISEGEA